MAIKKPLQDPINWVEFGSLKKGDRFKYPGKRKPNQVANVCDLSKAVGGPDEHKNKICITTEACRQYIDIPSRLVIKLPAL